MSENEIGFNTAFQAAGGVRRRAPVPYPLTHDSIRNMCIKRERLLRIQFENERFDDEDEATLASLSIDHPDQAFERYQLLLGLWHVWQRGYRNQSSTNDAEATRWMMLAREPVRVRVAGRVVDVTSRSRAALIRIQRHDAQRALLGEKLDLIEKRIQEARARGWLNGWKRRRRLLTLRERVEQEWLLHFRGILANALSCDGRAALPDEAPDWWDQVTGDDEQRILLALFEVGPLRMERGRLPKKPAKKTKGDEKEWTFSALLRYWEPKLHLPPMALDDVDLVQLLTAIEDGAGDSVADEALEELV